MDGGGAWVWRRRLLAWEEDSVRECTLLLHNTVLQENVSDTWRWNLDPINGHLVREAYRFITYNEQVDRGLVDDVWHMFIPAKVSLFVWCLLRNHLPTKDNLLRRRVIQVDGTTCAFGCGETESANHLFLGCEVSCSAVDRFVDGASLSGEGTSYTIYFIGRNAEKLSMCFQSHMVCLCLGDLEGPERPCLQKYGLNFFRTHRENQIAFFFVAES